jgi:hypothetical protein
VIRNLCFCTQTWHSGSRVPSGRDPQLLIVTAELLVNACKGNQNMTENDHGNPIVAPTGVAASSISAQDDSQKLFLESLAEKRFASSFAAVVDILGCIFSSSVSYAKRGLCSRLRLTFGCAGKCGSNQVVLSRSIQYIGRLFRGKY